jgi:hypothetical protein
MPQAKAEKAGKGQNPEILNKEITCRRRKQQKPETGTM